MHINEQLKGRLKKYRKKSNHLHSSSHILADELSNKMGEPKRFGFYLKMALKYDHNKLRGIAAKVLESKSRNPGALFTYLLSHEKKLEKSKEL